MSLPQQLKTARMTNATSGSSIDNEVGGLEQAVADILGLSVNTDVTASAFDLHQDGYVRKTLDVRFAGAAGIRMFDSTSFQCRAVVEGNQFLIQKNTGTIASPTWANLLAINITTGEYTTEPAGGSAATHSGALATSVAPLTIPTGTTDTIVALNSEEYDTDAYHDNTTNNSRLKVPTTSKYLVTANVLWDDASGEKTVHLYKNGSSHTTPSVVPGGRTNNFSHLISLTALDYLQLAVEHNSGVDRTITGVTFGISRQ